METTVRHGTLGILQLVQTIDVGDRSLCMEQRVSNLTNEGYVRGNGIVEESLRWDPRDIQSCQGISVLVLECKKRMKRFSGENAVGMDIGPKLCSKSNNIVVKVFAAEA